MNSWSILSVITLAAIISGGSTGFLGTYIVGMRIPFIGVVMSHAAMVGAVLAYLLGFPQFSTALVLAFAASLLLGLTLSHRSRMESDTHLSIIFSLMIGLTFLGMGLVKDDMTPLLGIMWGSILFVKPLDLIIMSILCLLLVVFGIVFHKELKAILFSRSIAMMSGIPVKLIYTLFLLLAAGIITANLNIVGGLMIYSLLCCPAAAAYELSRNLRTTLILSILFGILSAAGGLGSSYILNLPTGACITLMAVMFYGLAVVIRKYHPKE